MKVLVAGATGALGRQLVPRLVASGHEVAGMTRSASKRELVRELGRGRRWWPTRSTPTTVARAVASARARRHRPPAHRAGRLARHAPLRPRLRHDQPAADGGDRPPARRRPRRRRAPVRRPELRRLALRPHRRAGQDRGRSARSGAVQACAHARGHPPPRGRGHRRRLDRGRRAALRRLLRAGHVAGPRRRRARRDDPPAEVPAGRRRRRRLVVHPHRGRGGGHRGGGRARPARHLQHRRRRSGAGRRVAAGGGAGARRQAARGAFRAGSAGCSPARRQRS